jgi:hypothetical protein
VEVKIMETISELEFKKRIEQGIPYKGYVRYSDGTQQFVRLEILEQVTIPIEELEKDNLRGNPAKDILSAISTGLPYVSAFASFIQYTHPVQFGKYYNSLTQLMPIKGGVGYNQWGDVIIPDKLSKYSRDARWALKNMNMLQKIIRGFAFAGAGIETYNIIDVTQSDLPQAEKNKQTTLSGLNATFSLVSLAGPLGAAASITYLSIDIIFTKDGKGGIERTYDKAEKSYMEVDNSLKNWFYSWFYNAWGY